MTSSVNIHALQRTVKNMQKVKNKLTKKLLRKKSEQIDLIVSDLDDQQKKEILKRAIIKT